MPCIPATKTKSPARAPRLQVPSVLIAPVGLSVLTPFGDCAKLRLDATTIGTQACASRCNIGVLPLAWLCLHRRQPAPLKSWGSSTAKGLRIETEEAEEVGWIDKDFPRLAETGLATELAPHRRSFGEVAGRDVAPDLVPFVRCQNVPQRL